MQAEFAAKENAIKPTPPAIPNDVVGQLQIENSPRRRRKVVRSKTKTSRNRMNLEHGIRQRNSAGNASTTREAISIDQVKKLGSLFTGEDGLKEEDFIREIRKYVPSLSEHQITELFLKIDANADGRVDWDELTSYMFVHSSDADLISAEVDEMPRLLKKLVKVNS
eukprot:g82.t1